MEKKLEETKSNDIGEIKPEIIEEKAIEKEIVIPETPEEAPKIEAVPVEEKRETSWKPKTSLGREILEGKIKSIEEILHSGKKIMESEIVDYLVPTLQSDLILIGGRAGKGGGIQRIPIRITTKMHSSGRRFRTSSMIVVGNSDGIVGIGRGSSIEPRTSMEKALNKAKLSVIKIKRGCGDWECGCGTEHSIPFKTKGKSGSVRIELLPAPKGVGLVADNESKKILKIAGIKDVWVRSFGNTRNRVNLILAVYDALKKLYLYEK
ncbi:MAG: 30S ribosomal protein S5 [Candidatus Aenigmarchaeota archaeon]|nr:30S ribosomal protein S5 [Candidatus Aenigmarchaeota archaeon]